MSFTTPTEIISGVMVTVGSALLAFAASRRLMITGAVLIVSAVTIWHDRRVQSHHGREERREARYGDIVHRVMSRREEVTRLADRQAARSIRR